MWAIRNKRTKKWLYGTDYNYSPPRQRTSDDRVLTWETDWEARDQLKYRRCGKDYEVVPVRLEVLDWEAEDDAPTD